MEIFVKLCRIMVMDALVSGVRTSIASGSMDNIVRGLHIHGGSGLAGWLERTKHGQQQAKPRKRVGSWSLETFFEGWLW